MNNKLWLLFVAFFLITVFLLSVSCSLPMSSAKGMLSITLPGMPSNDSRSAQKIEEYLDGMIYQLDLTGPSAFIRQYAETGNKIIIELESGHWNINVNSSYFDPILRSDHPNEPLKALFEYGVPAGEGSRESVEIAVGRLNQIKINMKANKEFQKIYLSSIIKNWAELKYEIDNGSGEESFILANDLQSAWKADSTINIDRDITLLVVNGDDVNIERDAADINLLNVIPGGKLTLGIRDMDGTLKIDGMKSIFNNNEASLIRLSGDVEEDGTVKANGELVLHDGVIITGNIITGNAPNDRGGGVNVQNGGIFTMYGGEISENEANWGGGVFNQGTFIMEGGKISNNKARQGSGVHIRGFSWPIIMGTFTMYGGEISSNTGADDGGGVYLGGNTTNYAIFSMTNTAKVFGNEAITGAGVHISVGTLTMEEGTEISANKAQGVTVGTNIGGGVYLNSSGGRFIMNGGFIANDNTADIGAGVALSLGVTNQDMDCFTMSGGARVDNEVFLDDNYSSGGSNFRVITIDGILTANHPVAKIQPASYYKMIGGVTEEPRQIITGNTADNYTKFSVVQPIGSPSTVEWEISPSGNLQRKQ